MLGKKLEKLNSVEGKIRKLRFTLPMTLNLGFSCIKNIFFSQYVREVYFLLKVFFFLKFFFQLFERKASQMMENSSFNLRSQKLYFLLSIQIIFIFFFRTSFNLRSKNVCFLLSIHEIFICSLSICKAKIFICFFQYLIFISFFQSQKSF